MLLRFFRINDPYRLIGLLVFLILTSLLFVIHPAGITIPELKSFVVGEAIAGGKLLYVELIDRTPPLAAGIFGITDWLFGRSIPARQVTALLLIFFQASFFARLLINNKAYNDSTYVPALVFAVLCFFSFDMISFSPELLASTVLLLALNFLFKEIEFRKERDEVTLNLGVCAGVATLLVFSYILFLADTLIILFIFTRPNIRKVLLLLFGFLLPHLLLITTYYFLGEAPALWHGFYEANITAHRELWISLKGILTLCAMPGFYFILSFFILNRDARFTKYQSQLLQVMLLWMLAGAAQLLVTCEFSPHALIVFIPSLAYFISHYLLLLRRKWVAETGLWIFLVGTISISVLARHGKIDSVNYNSLLQPRSEYQSQIAGKRVMVLTNDNGIYLQNKLAGFFLDWHLSHEILEHPEYFENVSLVMDSFSADPPDVIIDPDDRMKAFFDRIPTLRYRRDGNLYLKGTALK